MRVSYVDKYCHSRAFEANDVRVRYHEDKMLMQVFCILWDGREVEFRGEGIPRRFCDEFDHNILIGNNICIEGGLQAWDIKTAEELQAKIEKNGKDVGNWLAENEGREF
ncbi:MAG: hypothetical protein K6A72_04410 [Lachnospiraceae bacterium]|nr:hypothetical protein [Lachnospiraceae bacterium]